MLSSSRSQKLNLNVLENIDIDRFLREKTSFSDLSPILQSFMRCDPLNEFSHLKKGERNLLQVLQIAYREAMVELRVLNNKLAVSRSVPVDIAKDKLLLAKQNKQLCEQVSKLSQDVTMLQNAASSDSVCRLSNTELLKAVHKLCIVCQKAFKSELYLIEHMFRRHPAKMDSMRRAVPIQVLTPDDGVKVSLHKLFESEASADDSFTEVVEVSDGEISKLDEEVPEIYVSEPLSEKAQRSQHDTDSASVSQITIRAENAIKIFPNETESPTPDEETIQFKDNVECADNVKMLAYVSPRKRVTFQVHGEDATDTLGNIVDIPPSPVSAKGYTIHPLVVTKPNGKKYSKDDSEISQNSSPRIRRRNIINSEVCLNQNNTYRYPCERQLGVDPRMSPYRRSLSLDKQNFEGAKPKKRSSKRFSWLCCGRKKQNSHTISIIPEAEVEQSCYKGQVMNRRMEWSPNVDDSSEEFYL